MKAFSILYIIVFFTNIGCVGVKGKSDSVSVQTDSIYHSKTIYSDEEINVFNDVTYSVKPSMGKMQYTSGKTKNTEIGLELLTLKMDIAVPPNARNQSKQPLIIFMHGGGFITGDKHDQTKAMMSFAKGGFVSATINYRLTRDRGKRGSAQNLAGVAKALEDAMNAIRFLKANAGRYSIDTTRIATIGYSAGGGLSLVNAFEGEDQTGIISDFPNINSKVQAAISTGVAIAGRTSENQPEGSSKINFSKKTTPVQVFHAKPKDGGASGKLWDDTVVPLQKLVEESGNTIEVVPQPNLTHTVDLSLDGPYWNHLKPFLWTHLNLGKLSKD